MAASAPLLDLPSATFDTATGAVYGGNGPLTVPNFYVSISGGPPLRVFLARSARLGNIRVTGAPGFVLLAEGEIKIIGRFTVGFGVGSDCNAGDGTWNDASTVLASSGSGGGGNATPGGRGGNLVTTSTSSTWAGGSAGGVIGNDAIVPLRGGCGAGSLRGAVSSPLTDYLGGGGGGAVQLASQTSIKFESGVIDARGATGNSIPKQDVMAIYGGGAGGSVLLEAPEVVLGFNSKIIAKGGRGGSGYYSSPNPNDSPDPEIGAGGDAVFGNGGDGAAVGRQATDGLSRTRPSSSANGGGGGGGGGLGRLRINTLTGAYAKDITVLEAAAKTTGIMRSR